MPALRRPSKWPAGMMRLVVCATLLAVGPGLTRPTQAAPRAAQRHSGLGVFSAQPLSPFQAPPVAAAASLASALHPDGSLNLPAGFRGSLDARGWRLASGQGAAPRFAPLAVPGDENWSDRFAPPGPNNTVAAPAVDGTGNLYAGGVFTTAGGTSANHVPQWDGSSWSALGSGMNSNVYALAVDGSGNLIAGGAFTAAGGASANYVARWNGSNWSAFGTGMNSYVNALAVDGSGNLVDGGLFTTAGGVSTNYIARWDGTSWSPLGGGMNDTVSALAVDGSGNLYAGGGFTTAGGKPSAYIARWSPHRLYLPVLLK